MSESKLTPRHVAIIMDGNGRWAQLRGKERYYGHMQGVEPVRAAVRAAIRRGVRYLTLYAFSTENWGRPAEEIDALMELFCRSVASETPELCKQGVRIAMIGDRSRFPAKVQEYLAQAERETAGSALYTAPYPDPDLVIRTSGEMRLSNFLLWQSSYAELYFPDVLWPDFTEADFDRAMEVFARRDRRFGLVQEN